MATRGTMSGERIPHGSIMELAIKGSCFFLFNFHAGLSRNVIRPIQLSDWTHGKEFHLQPGEPGEKFLNFSSLGYPRFMCRPGS